MYNILQQNVTKSSFNFQLRNFQKLGRFIYIKIPRELSMQSVSNVTDFNFLVGNLPSFMIPRLQDDHGALYPLAFTGLKKCELQEICGMLSN